MLASHREWQCISKTAWVLRVLPNNVSSGFCCYHNNTSCCSWLTMWTQIKHVVILCHDWSTPVCYHVNKTTELSLIILICTEWGEYITLQSSGCRLLDANKTRITEKWPSHDLVSWGMKHLWIGFLINLADIQIILIIFKLINRNISVCCDWSQNPQINILLISKWKMITHKLQQQSSYRNVGRKKMIIEQHLFQCSSKQNHIRSFLQIHGIDFSHTSSTF